MIVKNLKILLQNVHKNSLIVNTLLETQNQFDIILIQEPSWSEIYKIPSSSDCEGESLMGTNHHYNWISFARILSERSDSPRVIVYINIRLSSLWFLLRKDIIDHRDIILIVVATTCWNGTCSLLTSAKLSVGYLVVGITRELNKEPLLHCSSIYINTMWSVLQQCVYLMFYYSSTMLLPQGHHIMFMCPDIILF